MGSMNGLKFAAEKRDNGFTIVELLIVIVVIAVLAAITVVTFNGAYSRARNSSRITAAKQYIQLLQNYYTINGSYPFNSGRYCLGTGFTDVNSNGVGGCYNAATGDSWLTSESSTVNTELLEVGSLPNSPKDHIVGTDGIPRVGPIGIWKADGKLWVYYIIERPAASSCPLGSQEWGTTNTLICQVQVSS